jgi:quercetin dioxygenase-like cupin family protein
MVQFVREQLMNTETSPAPRTVITAVGGNGSSFFEYDGVPSFFMSSVPDGFLGDIWKLVCTPATTQDGAPVTDYELQPVWPGGAVFRVIQIPPEKSMQASGATGKSAEHGMHQTDTIDFVTILSGEIHLLLDGGEETLLKAGDTVVQRGTNHAWINRGSEPCRFSAVMIKSGR